jgi:hypothetical protein
MRRASPVALVFAAIFAPAGIYLVATAAVDLGRTRAFLARAARAEGVVTDVRPASRFNDAETVVFDAGGKAHEFQASPARVPAPLGARVPVLYDPANPAVAEIDRYEELYHDIVVRSGLGLLLALLGLGVLAGWLRRRRSGA